MKKLQLRESSCWDCGRTFVLADFQGRALEEIAVGEDVYCKCLNNGGHVDEEEGREKPFYCNRYTIGTVTE